MTDPERFKPLHDHADAIVAQLQALFEVQVEDGEAGGVPHGIPVPGTGATRVVRLQPAAGAAPITIQWTNFPGLVVTVGRWTSRSYPLCGWDDCGEDPAHEAGDLYQLVKWVVDGWFREGLTADLRLFHEFPNKSSWQRVPPEHLPADAQPGTTIVWRAWKARRDAPAEGFGFFRRSF